MKKLILIITLAIVFAFSNMAMAEQPHVTVGLKTWFATWESKIDGGGIFENKTVKSDYGVMYGPAVNIKYEKFFGGISYLLGSFSFKKETLNVLPPFDTLLGSTISMEPDADRKDLDILAGYYFHPNIGAFLGYKTIDRDFNDKLNDIKWNEKFKGPALGITGHYPIDNTRWILFGTASYLSMSGKSEGEDLGDINGPAIEFGGAYAAEAIPLSASIGYKYQSYDWKDGGSEIFSGLTFGVNYSIQ